MDSIDQTSGRSDSEIARERRRSRGAYCRLWVWVLAVTGLSVMFYVYAIEFFLELTLTYTGAKREALDKLKGTPISYLLQILGGILVCWRGVKTFALLGSPFAVGMKMNLPGDGRAIGFIGEFRVANPNARLWFAVLARAHPNSAKVMRSRIEYLHVGLPYSWVLIVTEGRWRVARNTGAIPEFAHRFYDFLGVDAAKPQQSKRIDGLTWVFSDSRIMSIRDDFGRSLAVHPARNGRGFEVMPRLPEDVESRYVPTIGRLRRFARLALEPVKVE